MQSIYRKILLERKRLYLIYNQLIVALLETLTLVSLIGSPINITLKKASCDARGQDTTYPGMCECEEGCCTSQAQTEEGCPVDIVIAIDMCSCNNDTWHDMKGKSQTLNLISLYGISYTSVIPALMLVTIFGIADN